VKSYRPYTPDQSFLLPPSPREWLPSGHLVFFVVEFVGQLDICSIERKLQASDPRGERPYSPRMMTALLLYGYATGVYSSRRLERATISSAPRTARRSRRCSSRCSKPVSQPGL